MPWPPALVPSPEHPTATPTLSPQTSVSPGAAPRLHHGLHLAAEEEQHRGALVPLPGHRPAGIPAGKSREWGGTPQGTARRMSLSAALSPLRPALPVRARPGEKPGIPSQGAENRLHQRRVRGQSRGLAVRRAVAQGGGGRAGPRRVCAPGLLLHLLQAAGTTPSAGPGGKHLPGAGRRAGHPGPGE